MLKKIIIWTICFLIIISCSANKSPININKEDFEKQFFLHKRFYSTMKQKFPNKNEIVILDSKQLITKEALSFYNRDFRISIKGIENSNSDLFVKFYKLNNELAYAVFWANDNDAICFIVVRNDKTWNIADVMIRNIR